jgi:hypothetical protein
MKEVCYVARRKWKPPGKMLGRSKVLPPTAIVTHVPCLSVPWVGGGATRRPHNAVGVDVLK